MYAKFSWKKCINLWSKYSISLIIYLVFFIKKNFLKCCQNNTIEIRLIYKKDVYTWYSIFHFFVIYISLFIIYTHSSLNASYLKYRRNVSLKLCTYFLIYVLEVVQWWFRKIVWVLDETYITRVHFCAFFLCIKWLLQGRFSLYRWNLSSPIIYSSFYRALND